MGLKSRMIQRNTNHQLPEFQVSYKSPITPDKVDCMSVESLACAANERPGSDAYPKGHWVIQIGEEKLEVPYYKEDAGKMTGCNRCRNQLDCLANKVGSLITVEDFS